MESIYWAKYLSKHQSSSFTGVKFGRGSNMLEFEGFLWLWSSFLYVYVFQSPQTSVYCFSSGKLPSNCRRAFCINALRSQIAIFRPLLGSNNMPDQAQYWDRQIQSWCAPLSLWYSWDVFKWKHRKHLYSGSVNEQDQAMPEQLPEHIRIWNLPCNWVQGLKKKKKPLDQRSSILLPKSHYPVVFNFKTCLDVFSNPEDLD